MPVKRNYNVKDVDMLIAASAIVETAIANKADLQKKRIVWADPFFDTLKTKIDHVLQTYLGIDSARDMRLSTAAIRSVQKDALRDLAEVKVQLMEDLKGQKDVRTELLRTLGFTGYLIQARSGKQEGLIDLLYQFKLNLTVTVRNQIITGTGVPATLLDAIVGYADFLKNANVGQEMVKGARKATTQEALIAFNEIYDSVISISKIAAKFYRDNSALKDQFNFTKVLKGINGNVKPTPRQKPIE